MIAPSVARALVEAPVNPIALSVPGMVNDFADISPLAKVALLTNSVAGLELHAGHLPTGSEGGKDGGLNVGVGVGHGVVSL